MENKFSRCAGEIKTLDSTKALKGTIESVNFNFLIIV